MIIAYIIGGLTAALTAYGIYAAFGPPSKKLTDPFDHHDD